MKPKRKAYLALLAAASSISVLSVNQQASNAYSMTNWGFELNKGDVGRTIDPIKFKSTSNSKWHSHEIRLTLHSYDESTRVGTFSASVINNTPDALLTHMYFNRRNEENPSRWGWRKISFKGSGMGVKGDGQERVFTDLQFKFNNNHVLRFNHKRVGWWSDKGGDYHTETVPEPLTIFGTALAGAFGLGFKRRRQKQQHQQEA